MSASAPVTSELRDYAGGRLRLVATPAWARDEPIQLAW
jgi:hypothetical protein